MKTPQEIAKMASELMEALEEYIHEVDVKVVLDAARAGRPFPLPAQELRVRNIFCELYGPMIKWKFDVERLALDNDTRTTPHGI